ncbi:hypothetical protein FQA39_LY17883 [Lamprigera yunnana]|nr:hypothetical protein FQA39_LY17883 [Lamprigera yunnana]
MCKEVLGQLAGEGEPCKIVNVSIVGTVCKQQCSIATASRGICGSTTGSPSVKLTCCFLAKSFQDVS